MGDLQWDHLVPIESHEKVLAELEDTRKELEALREQTRWVPVSEGYPEVLDEGALDCITWSSADKDWDIQKYWGHPAVDRYWTHVTHYKVLSIQPPTEQEG